MFQQDKRQRLRLTVFGNLCLKIVDCDSRLYMWEREKLLLPNLRKYIIHQLLSQNGIQFKMYLLKTSFKHPVHKYLLSTYAVPGIVPEIWDTPCEFRFQSVWSLCSSREEKINKSNKAHTHISKLEGNKCHKNAIRVGEWVWVWGALGVCLGILVATFRRMVTGHCIKKLWEVAMHLSGGRLVPAEQNGPDRGDCCARFLRQSGAWVSGVFLDDTLEQSEQRGKW